jgi:hypothetical protein
MDSVLIFASEFVIFSIVLSLYLCRRHTILKQRARAEPFDETPPRRVPFFSGWRRVGRSHAPAINPANELRMKGGIYDLHGSHKSCA